MESTVQVTFVSLVQGTQMLKTPNEADDRMNARLVFTIAFEGREYRGGTVELNQPHGTSYEGAPIECFEVRLPAGFNRKLRHDDMHAAAERYYRSQIGSTGTAFRVEGATNVKMEGNTVVAPRSFPIRLATEETGW